MSSPYCFEKIKAKKAASAARREAIRDYLAAMGTGFVASVGRRAGVSHTMVSKVLHGRAVSARVERAILDEESQAKGKVRTGNAA